MNGIWILGATGRVGKAVSAILAAEGQCVTLIGRDADRLQRVAQPLGDRARIVTVPSLDAIVGQIGSARPSVVINTIGPFADSAVMVAAACPPGSHYVDLCNELTGTQALLALHDKAVRNGSTYVTGAGFGVLATEAAVIRLCAERDAPMEVRVDALPAVQSEPGRLGRALAASILGALVQGGQRVVNGRLSRTRLFDDFRKSMLPTGETVATAAYSSSELIAAQGASRANSVVAASSVIPSSPILRALLPGLLSALRIKPIFAFAIRQVANIQVKQEAAATEQVSWAHAEGTWADGTRRHVWLRSGDAMQFTAAVLAEVAIRLTAGRCAAGAYTPGSLFGAELAEDCGGSFHCPTAAVSAQ